MHMQYHGFAPFNEAPVQYTEYLIGVPSQHQRHGEEASIDVGVFRRSEVHHVITIGGALDLSTNGVEVDVHPEDIIFFLNNGDVLRDPVVRERMGIQDDYLPRHEVDNQLGH